MEILSTLLIFIIHKSYSKVKWKWPYEQFIIICEEKDKIKLHIWNDINMWKIKQGFLATTLLDAKSDGLKSCHTTLRNGCSNSNYYTHVVQLKNYKISIIHSKMIMIIRNNVLCTYPIHPGISTKPAWMMVRIQYIQLLCICGLS